MLEPLYYSDGAARGNLGYAAVGGIIRGHLGTHFIIFSEFLGERTNNFVELYAIWRGLDLCSNMNFAKVWVETDSTTTLHLINKCKASHCLLHGLLIKIWVLMEKVDTRFSHIFREGNVVADWLANEGCD
ncbi:hypothetical protein OROMI_004810 [Orobanche minor]